MTTSPEPDLDEADEVAVAPVPRDPPPPPGWEDPFEGSALLHDLMASPSNRDVADPPRHERSGEG